MLLHHIMMRPNCIIKSMMTSTNRSIFHVTGPFWGESTGDWWFPLTKASDTKLWCFLRSTPEQMVDQTIKSLLIWDAISVMSLWLRWLYDFISFLPCPHLRSCFPSPMQQLLHLTSHQIFPRQDWLLVLLFCNLKYPFCHVSSWVYLNHQENLIVTTIVSSYTNHINELIWWSINSVSNILSKAPCGKCSLLYLSTYVLLILSSCILLKDILCCRELSILFDAAYMKIKYPHWFLLHIACRVIGLYGFKSFFCKKFFV